MPGKNTFDARMTIDRDVCGDLMKLVMTLLVRDADDRYVRDERLKQMLSPRAAQPS
jgi:hypothetical protein